MRNMKEHLVWAVTADNSIVCLGILEDVETGEFFPVHSTYADVGYKADGNYSTEEESAIQDAGAEMRRYLGGYWSTLAAVRDPLRAGTLREAVQMRL